MRNYNHHSVKPSVTPSAGAESPARVRKSRPPRLLTAAELAGAAWMRLPAPRARCPLTGLSRTGLIDLVERSGGAVRVARLQRPGTARGIVLIGRESLLAYLDRIAAEGGAA
ncbi:MAG TPA: hypothetical protein PLU30_15960 [Verrucomicrobiae bacterium]|nr:hypothetical protein [Verrucomicrobiae bacterium]